MIELLQENYNIEDEKYIPLRKMLDKQNIEDNLVVPLGIDKEANNRYIGFNDIPCLLITGETGSGKSILIDCIIISLIIKNNSNNIKFIMMDPKKIELNYYNELDYMLDKTINDKKTGAKELEKIYKEYKKRKETEKKEPHIFIIIDESCDLMQEDNSLKIIKNMIEDCDKYGLHFIIATNTPYEGYFDKDLIKKIKTKITFDLTSKKEACWIGIRNSEYLHTPGEAIANENNKRIIIKTPYISNEDIQKVINHIKNI